MGDSLVSLQNLATNAANEFNVPVSLFLAQIGAESDWNPNAVGGEPANNGEYAQGIAQFLPSTGSQFGLNTTAQLDNPALALPAAAEYDSQLYQQAGGNWVSALQSYGTLPTNGTLTATQQNLLSIAQGLTGNTNVADEYGATPGNGVSTFSNTPTGATSPTSPTNSAAATAAALNPGGLAGIIPNIGLMVLGVVMIYVGLTRGGAGGAVSLVLPKGSPQIGAAA
jgi:hypothetical protein